MYFQNGNYMQDLNYYNQIQNYNFIPYQNYINPNPNNQMSIQNSNSMYPAVYRIIIPVVKQVLSNNYNGYLTEESLNKMVDSVYNIVEGDISTGSTNNNENGENINSSNYVKTSNSSNQVQNSTNQNNKSNALLRDLIKILILNEIFLKRQYMANQMMMQNPNINNQMNI